MLWNETHTPSLVLILPAGPKGTNTESPPLVLFSHLMLHCAPANKTIMLQKDNKVHCVPANKTIMLQKENKVHCVSANKTIMLQKENKVDCVPANKTIMIQKNLVVKKRDLEKAKATKQYQLVTPPQKWIGIILFPYF